MIRCSLTVDRINGVHLDLAKAEKPKGLMITVSVEILWSLLVYNACPRCPFTSLTFVVFPEKIRAETTLLGQEEEFFLDKLEPVWAPRIGVRRQSRWATHVPVLNNHSVRRDGRTWSKGIIKAFLAPTHMLGTR